MTAMAHAFNVLWGTEIGNLVEFRGPNLEHDIKMRMFTTTKCARYPVCRLMARHSPVTMCGSGIWLMYFVNRCFIYYIVTGNLMTNALV